MKMIHKKITISSINDWENCSRENEEELTTIDLLEKMEYADTILLGLSTASIEHASQGCIKQVLRELQFVMEKLEDAPHRCFIKAGYDNGEQKFTLKMNLYTLGREVYNELSKRIGAPNDRS